MLKRLLLLILVAAILIPSVGCSRKNEPPPVEEPVEAVAPQEPEEVDLSVVLKKVAPVTVIINNHPDARPPSGLQEASIVYEFLVEGGTTRFLCVYDTVLKSELVIGPVRSLRPYLGVQSLEHGGVIAHSGMSERTREIIRGMGLKQVGDNGVHMWRDSSRRAPHNLYTNIERLYKARGESDVREETVEPPELPAGFAVGKELEIVYYSNNKVSYTYDEEKELYLRFINGDVHSDRESGLQYSTRRVIVRTAKHTNIPGPGALVDVNLEGSGEGKLYEAGRMYELSWEKKDGVTSFYYQDGSLVDMSYGNTWIQVVRSSG